ncbi:MAG: cyclic nucleotide-binding domain-containing protein [Deltaproteobacteria bacterium]|nr:MAG: cyclic nucleotide-binding domain-containing protein [Deltaproteobacteria bacterium]
MIKKVSYDHNLLRSNPLFAMLSDAEFQHLCEKSHSHRYQAGQAVVREGEPALGLYLLVSGKVKVVKKGVFGRSQIVRMANSGDLLTYRAVSGIPQYVVSAMTMEESLVFYLHLENVLDILKKNGVFAYTIIQKLTQELDNAEKLFAISLKKQ